MQRKEDVVREWHHYDAEGKILGRLAVEVAKKLMGKEKITFTPHIDGGDFVVATNVAKMVVTGKKLTDKKYYNHSGFPGGIRERKLGEILDKKPDRKSTRLNSSHANISYAVFCLKILHILSSSAFPF